MVQVNQSWPADAFDAIGIRVNDGNIAVRGFDGDEVKLEADVEEKHLDALRTDRSGRWLNVYTQPYASKLKLTIWLPEHKAWMLDLFAGRVNLYAAKVHACFHIMVGSGEVHIEDCRGIFAAATGHGDITLEHFKQEDVPEIYRMPDEERQSKQDRTETVLDWGKDYWTQWGLDISEKILRKLFGQTGVKSLGSGISVKTGNGHLRLDEIEAGTCVVRSASSNASLTGGIISGLDVNILRGDVECESCRPAGDWSIKTNYGDILLSLPYDVSTRLDVATRLGDIQSGLPMVRVARQGPGAWHGGRMVGAIGKGTDAKAQVPEIYASTLRGDIKINVQPADGLNDSRTKDEQIPVAQSMPGTGVSFDTSLDILQALSEGRITVDEAEKLLRSLGRRNKTD